MVVHYLRLLLLSGIVLALLMTTECHETFGYDVLNSESDTNIFEFQFLRHKRQASFGADNNLKTKSADGKSSVQKFDKNSAAAEGDASLSVKKNLEDSALTPQSGDDDIIKEFVNETNTSTPKPLVYHDYHQYYNSTVVTEPDKIDHYWVDLKKMGETVITHDMLSRSYRRAATVPLKFDFPFYGHLLKNATIATGGFLYLGDYMHSWLASTQYIAPLMANFDTSLSEKSYIKYADNGTDFVVQWEATYLQDNTFAGPFTFQARLKHTGDIVFAYKDIPVTITSIPDHEHPVRVGVSDAYIVDRTLIAYKRKIIYEYHRVEISKERIANLTAVYLTALPSCITLKDCRSCQSTTIDFKCVWCEDARRCSDGMDRHRHDWLVKGCDSLNEDEPKQCPASQIPTSPDHFKNTTDDTVSSDLISENLPENHELLPVNDSSFIQLQNLHQLNGFSHFRGALGAAGIIGILFVVAVIFGFISWLIYAYKFPHSPSGQVIIKYRPSQWHWNRGEANYTPASVHI